jgi:transposase
MKWPANSPNLNPIKNVWRLLKYRVGDRFPKTDEEVRQYIEEEWERLQIDAVCSTGKPLDERACD